MGYTTDFYGKFELNKPLDKETFDFLKKFSKTRRMKRDAEKLKEYYGESFGIDGEFFTKGKGFKGQDGDDTVVDVNMPPKTQPGLWCQWIPSEDKKYIIWDGVEKFYESEAWIQYIITKILEPKGYILNGIVAAKGESENDFWRINIQDNEVSSQEGWDGISLKNGFIEQTKYALKVGTHYLVYKDNYDPSETDPQVWSDLNPNNFFKIITFDSIKEAEEYFKKVRLDSLFVSSGSNQMEVVDISNEFIVLNSEIIVVNESSDYEQPTFGIVVDPVFDFEKYSVKCLEPMSFIVEN